MTPFYVLSDWVKSIIFVSSFLEYLLFLWKVTTTKIGTIINLFDSFYPLQQYEKLISHDFGQLADHKSSMFGQSILLYIPIGQIPVLSPHMVQKEQEEKNFLSMSYFFLK